MSLVPISRAFFSNALGGLEVPLLLALFIAAHSVSHGAAIWVFISEVLPNHVRARGQSFDGSIHWAFAASSPWSCPGRWEPSSAARCLPSSPWMMLLHLGFVMFLMPETKNVSLEQLQKHLVGDNVSLRRVRLSAVRAKT